MELYRNRGPETFTEIGSRHPGRSRFLEFLSDLDYKLREFLRELHFDLLDLLHPRYPNAGAQEGADASLREGNDGRPEEVHRARHDASTVLRRPEIARPLAI